MANIANGYLEIIFDKTSELNKSAVDEIINNLENNNHFTYCGLDGFNAIFNEEDRTLDLDFSGRRSCDSCWEWIENELSDAKDNKELNPEARTLLINSEIIGGSFEFGAPYRDRVTKKKGVKKLDIYYHSKLDSKWWEVLEIINAFNLNEGVSQNFGNGVEVTLCEKSESEQYLFKIEGGVGGFIVLYDKSDKEDHPQPIFFCESGFGGELEELSIKAIIEGLESGDLEELDDFPESFHGTGELIYDLIGDSDDFFELEEEELSEEELKLSEQRENDPKLNTTDWRQHKRRLDKFGESKYQDAHIFVGPKGGTYEMRISKKTGKTYRHYF
mgnify:FL=1